MKDVKQMFKPRIGMRFTIRGSKFEVCFAEMGMVRYASTKGGKQHRITFERFMELQADELEVINPQLHGQDLMDPKPSFVNLSVDECDATLRRSRYAKGAVAELVFPNSIRQLREWIPEFAKSIKDDSPPNSRTVSRWVNKFLRHGNDGFVAVQRKRGNRYLRFAPDIELLILEAVELFLKEEEQRDTTDVLSYIVGNLAEQGLLTKDGSKLKTPCVRTVRRYLNRIDPYLLTRIRKGVLAAEKMARAAGKSIISPRPLFLVQIDTHFLKVFIIDPDTGEILGKPYLTCAIDVRTRCIVGIFVSLLPASTTTTLAVLKDMFSRPTESGLPGGVPVNIVPDNGIEFKNSGVERLCSKLCIHFEPAMVRDPNGKPHIESFFRTLSRFVIQKIKGTTFSNLEERGVYFSEGKAYATLDKLEEYIRDWVEGEYHLRPHSQTGRVPIRHWEEETAKSKPMSLTREEANIMARRPYRCKINGGRVTVEKNAYYSHALKTLEALHEGSVTVLVNEQDLGDVLVEHPFEKNTLITADSTDPEYTRGLSMWEHEEAQKIKAQMTKKDLQAVGKFANLLARYQLLQKLQADSKFARSKIAKLTQGKGLHSKDPGDLKFAEEKIQPSDLEQTFGYGPLSEQESNFMDKEVGAEEEINNSDNAADLNSSQNADGTANKSSENSIYFME